jgi:predicted nuclease of predicted toxin-antitoxin system
MKIKLDENMPASLVKNLAALGHDVDTIPQEGLAGEKDSQVWASAQREGRFLITQDLDLSDVHRFAPGTHHGILLVRLHEPGRPVMSNKVITLFENEEVEGWLTYFVDASDQKIRVQRPSK